MEIRPTKQPRNQVCVCVGREEGTGTVRCAGLFLPPPPCFPVRVSVPVWIIGPSTVDQTIAGQNIAIKFPPLHSTKCLSDTLITQRSIGARRERALTQTGSQTDTATCLTSKKEENSNRRETETATWWKAKERQPHSCASVKRKKEKKRREKKKTNAVV